MTHPYNEVHVTIDRREPVHVFWVLVLVAVVIYFLKWILLGAAILGVAGLLWTLSRREYLRTEGLRTRADLQHQQVLRGDARGIYGEGEAHEGPRTPTAEGR
jgi:hypothetical protein